MRRLFLAAALALVPAAASAHEIWIERDATGPARIYLGEPEQPLPEGGDPEFAKLTAPHVAGATGTPVRRAGFLEVQVPAGDVRAWDDAVFAPWGEAGAKEGVVYYARAGRAEPRAALPFEIVPVAADADRFTLVRDGRPLAGVEVRVIAPGHRTSTTTTDAEGRFEVAADAPGRYLLAAAVEDGAATLPGGPVAKVHRITTTSFVR